MRKRDYRERQKARDIHEQHKRKEDVVVPLEEVFFVLTRDGVDAFNSMFENSLRNVVAEEVDKAFRSVADGIREGLAGIISGTVTEAVKQEATATEEIREAIERAVQQTDDLDKDNMTLEEWGKLKADFEEEIKAVTPKEALEDALRDTTWSLDKVGPDWQDDPVEDEQEEPFRFRLFPEERYCKECGNLDCEKDHTPPAGPTRKHAGWTESEDLELIAAVFAGVKEGKPRTTIFKEQAEILGRTAAAIQYRWNSKFAAIYKEDIAQILEK